MVDEYDPRALAALHPRPSIEWQRQRVQQRHSLETWDNKPRPPSSARAGANVLRRSADRASSRFFPSTEQARERRDAIIRCWYDDGASIAEIARTADLTRQRVWSILRGNGDG